MIFRKIINKFLTILPRKISAPIIRSKVKVVKPNDKLTIKIATTEEEYLEAFKIIYSSYRDVNYVKANTEKMKMSHYHSLLYTHLVVLYYEDKLVGTLSIVQDNPYGLPSDEDFDVDRMRASHHCHIAEVSSLAIAKDYRGGKDKLFLPLKKFLYEYSKSYLGVSDLLIGVTPRQAPFYSAILGFEDLDGKTISDPLANGEEITCLRLKITEGEEKLKAWYSHKPEDKNLYKFMCEDKFENSLVYPAKSPIYLFHNVLSEEVIEKIITRELALATPGTKYYNLLMKRIKNLYFKNRKEYSVRYGVHIKATETRMKSIINATETRTKSHIRIVDISLNGGHFIFDHSRSFEINQMITINFKLLDGQEIFQKGRVCWVNKNRCGFQIYSASENWHEIFKKSQDTLNYNMKTMRAS